jgi:hypothetical protein
VAFAFCELLGFSLMPRLMNANDFVEAAYHLNRTLGIYQDSWGKLRRNNDSMQAESGNRHKG